jgi:hypothetical protein
MGSLLSLFKGYLVKFSLNTGQKDLWFFSGNSIWALES